MAKPSSRTTGNDKPADPGGTRPAPKSAKAEGPKAENPKAENKVQSGDRNAKPAKPATRIK